MKKITVLLLTVCLLAGLAACGKRNGPASATDVKEPEPEDIYSGVYTDPDINEPALRIAKKDDGGYDVYISIYRLTLLDDGVGTLKDDGLHFTATDANGTPISGVITPEGDGMKVTFTDSKWPLLENGTTFTYIKSEASAGDDGQNPVMNFIGEYVCDRARARVECSGKEDAKVTIEWGGSAWTLARWVMTGKLDTDTLKVEYSDCVKTEITYNDKGEETKTVTEYENGKGYFVFSMNSTFTWHDGTEERADMTFEWAPVA